jgi:hypothetical protein
VKRAPAFAVVRRWMSATSPVRGTTDGGERRWAMHRQA